MLVENTLFAHDHLFRRDSQGRIWSAGKFPYVVFERYLQFSKNLTVLGRVEDNDDVRGFTLSSGPGITFQFLPNLASIKSFFGPRKKSRNIIVDAIRSVDAVIARLPSIIGNSAAVEAQKLGAPLAIEVVGCPWDALWNYGTLRGKVYAPFATLRMKKAVLGADRSIYVTSEFLQRRYPTEGLAFACSDVEIPEPDAAVLERRIKRLETPPTLFKVGLIGSLNSASKGFSVIFKALGIANRDGMRFKLEIVGGGNSKKWQDFANREGVAEAVTFVGALPSGARVLEWLESVDIYVQPSFQEGLPRALVEAMSRGCPALASTAGGMPELLDSSRLHKPGDHETLARQLVQLAADDELMRQQAAKNFAIAKDFSQSLLTERRTTFYREFLSQAGNKESTKTGTR